MLHRDFSQENLPSLSLRDISPKGRDKFELCGKPKPSSLRKVARHKP